MSIEAWFKSELKFRTTASVLWTWFFSIIAIHLYWIDFHIPEDPVKRLFDLLIFLTSVSTWARIVICYIIQLSFILYQFRSYKEYPEIRSSRWEVFRVFLKTTYILEAVWWSFSSFVFIWTLRLSSMIVQCRKSGSNMYCLSDFHVDELIFAVTVGSALVYHYHLYNLDWIMLPVFQESRNVRVRTRLQRFLLFDILLPVIIVYVAFGVCHFLFAHHFKDVISQVSGYQFYVRREPGLILRDAHYSMRLLRSGVTVGVLSRVSGMIFSVYSTEVDELKLKPELGPYSQVTLLNALQTKRNNLLKQMGFYEFARLTKFKQSLFGEFFRVTEPGLEAHLWKIVYGECIDTIHDLTLKIECFNVAEIRRRTPLMLTPRKDRMVEGRKRLDPTIRPTTQKTPFDEDEACPPLLDTTGTISEEELARRLYRAHEETTVGLRRRMKESSLLYSGRCRHVYNTGEEGCYSCIKNAIDLGEKVMRNGGLEPGTEYFWTIGYWFFARMQDLNPTYFGESIPAPTFAQLMQFYVDKVKYRIKKNRWFNWLFGEIPAAANARNFADFQIQQWAIEGLVRIVVASYTLDKYGMVQQDLPEILMTLMDLKKALFINQLLTIAARRRAALPNEVILCMHHSGRPRLLGTVNRALYRLVRRFGYTLLNVPLPEIYAKRIRILVRTKREL